MKKIFRYAALFLLVVMFIPLFSVQETKGYAGSYEDPVEYYNTVTDRKNLTDVYGGEML